MPSTQLSADGNYTVTLDPSNDAAGEATVRVIDVVDQHAVITADGSPVTATIGQPGAVSRLRFTGTAGQKVSVVELRDRANKELANGCIHDDGAGFIDTTTLRVAGEYTILVDPNDAATGDAQVQLFNVVDQDAVITADGSPVTATIGQPGAVSRLRFTGTAGQKVSVVVTSSTLPNQCGVLGLRDRANKELANGCIIDGTGFIDTTTLPTTGDYTILIDPDDAATGDAPVHLYPE